MNVLSNFQNFKRYYFKQYVVALIISFTFLLINGFQFPMNNNMYHVPIVLDYFNSLEGPHDPYTQSLSKFVSLFWLVIKPFINESNIYYSFLAIYTVCLFVTTLIYLILISDISPKETTWIGLITAGTILLTMSKESVLGHNEVLITYLTHSQVVIPFVLFSVLLLSRSQYIFAAASLGVAFNINAFVAIWGILISVFTMIIVGLSQKKSFRVKTAIAMFAVFSLFAIPTFIWIFKTVESSPDSAAFNYIEYLRQFYSLHNLVDTQKKVLPEDILLLLLMWSLILFVGKRQSRLIEVTFQAFGVGLTSVLTLGVFLPYLTSSRLLNNLYPLRMDAFAYWLIAILAGAWFVNIGKVGVDEVVKKVGVWAALLNFNVLLTLFLLLDAERGKKNALKFLTFASTSIACLLITVKGTWSILTPFITAEIFQDLSTIVLFIVFIQSFTLGLIASEANQLSRFLALSPLVFGFLLYIPNAQVPSWLILISLLAAMLSFFEKRAYFLAYACIALLPIICFKLNYPFLLSLLPWFAQVLCISGYLFHQGFVRNKSIHFNGLYLPLLVLSFLFLFGGFKAILRGGINSLSQQEVAFNEAQLWARSHTSPDTVFLTIDSPGFSVLSRRPVWVDAKWGAVVMWAPELYSMVSTRMQSISKVKSLSDAIELAKSQNIAYVVAPSSLFGNNISSKSELVYKNQYYLIYKVKV